MHRSALGDLLIDAAPDVHDLELEFWQQATGATLRPLGDAGAHTRLRGRWSAIALTMQRLGDGDSRVHFDVMTDDVAAEAARLESVGATRERSMDGWEVMRDPAGFPDLGVLRPGNRDARHPDDRVGLRTPRFTTTGATNRQGQSARPEIRTAAISFPYRRRLIGGETPPTR